MPSKNEEFEENSQNTDMSGFSVIAINDESLTQDDRSGKFCWSEAEEEQFDPERFIEEVRKLQSLWNIFLSSYKDHTVKENAWDKLANIFRKDGKYFKKFFGMCIFVCMYLCPYSKF